MSWTIGLGDLVTLTVGLTLQVDELGWPGNDMTYSGLTSDGTRGYFKVGQVIAVQPSKNTTCDTSNPAP